MRELFSDVDRWLSEGKPVAVATVVSVAGSAPRGVGAKLAVSKDGEFAGSVSGGCVENAVIETALEVLQSGHPQLVTYGVTDEDAWEVGLACGGTIQVFVEPLAGPHPLAPSPALLTRENQQDSSSLKTGNAPPSSPSPATVERGSE